jgi:hypothetical protein
MKQQAPDTEYLVRIRGYHNPDVARIDLRVQSVRAEQDQDPAPTLLPLRYMIDALPAD